MAINVEEATEGKGKPGVKADDGVSGARRQVRMDDESEAIYSKIGNGNVSLGLREGARRLAELGEDDPFDLARHLRRKR